MGSEKTFIWEWRDLNPQMSDVLALYQVKIGPLSSTQRDELLKANKEGVTPFVLGCAILVACEEQRRVRNLGRLKRIGFNYVLGIVRDWKGQGILTERTWKEYYEKQYVKGQIQGANAKGIQDFGAEYPYSEPSAPKKTSFIYFEEES